MTTLESISIVYNLVLILGATWYFNKLTKFGHAFSVAGLLTPAAILVHFFIIAKILSPEIAPLLKGINSPLINIMLRGYWIAFPLRYLVQLKINYSAKLAQRARVNQLSGRRA